MCAKKIIEEEFVEKIKETPLQKAIHNFMLPYSEYVILDRALPRVEDGLKPVQRRVLYTMYEMGLKPDGPFKKSARVVGDCLGKYHPHGNDSIYNAMVNMAQDFKMREPLVKGHGNFGSIDGDRAAAMRYTEVKMAPLAAELMSDIDKGTVPWTKNFDETLEEPEILPSRIPNLLINGCPMGIAVGLTTKIPPQNFSEVIDGVIAYIDNPCIKLKDMMGYIKGPDFPTGGYIENKEIEKLYETGEGKMMVAARYDIEFEGKDRQNIVITELPYDLNKSKIQEDILKLRDSETEKNGKNDNILAGITEIADESDRHGIRIVIRLKKGENVSEIVKFLFKKTKLMQSYNAVMMAIVNGKPEQLTLLSMIKHYVNHRRNIILNRSKFDCNIAKKRAHVVEGFVLVLPDLKELCNIIIDANSTSDAKAKIRERFSLSEAQADSILATKLSSLTKMERTKLGKELVELNKKIEELEKIINSTKEQLNVVKQELLELKGKYKSKRQTVIVDSIEDTLIDPYSIEAKDGKSGFLVIGADGTLRFVPPRQYHNARKSGEETGSAALAAQVINLDSGYAIVFGSKGNCYRFKTNEARENAWTDAGMTLQELFVGATPGEKAVSAIAIKDDSDINTEIFIATKNGFVKRGVLSDYIVNKDIYQAMVMKDDTDEVIKAELRKPECSLLFVTEQAMCVNTDPEEFSLQGRKAGGVTAINLASNDKLLLMAQCEQDREDDGYYPLGEVLVVTTGAKAKRVIIGYMEKTKRASKGLKLIDMNEKKEKLAAAMYVLFDYNIALVDAEMNVKIMSTEDILIEQRRTPGKNAGQLKNCIFAVKDIPDGVFEEERSKIGNKC